MNITKAFIALASIHTFIITKRYLVMVGQMNILNPLSQSILYAILLRQAILSYCRNKSVLEFVMLKL